MKHLTKNLLPLFLISFLLFSGCHPQGSGLRGGKDPLPSWNDTPRKEAIVDFVTTVTNKDSTDYLPPEAWIAVFDNDGTLWSEKPLYFQLYFIFDRIRALAPQHPEWKKDKLIKAVLKNDIEKVRKFGAEGLARLMVLTQAGMSAARYEAIVTKWIKQAKHPTTGRLYTEMVFQPMLEVIRYLQENDFEVYIVSGGGQDFMRPWTLATYGIPPDHVIGSRQKLEYEIVNGKPVLMRLPDVDFVNDEEGKPVSIHYFVGRKPVLAFGNSDGDIQMMQWTTSGKGKRLSFFVHHNDAKREWAYDRNSVIGKLDKGFEMAKKNRWLLIDMKKDWKVIHPYELQK